jgi:serine phosphatase RsbU (regulator of sigma subunit)
LVYEDEQLRLARMVQSALLPPPLIDLPGLQVSARFLPSANVSGDFLDYFALGTRWLALYLGDVQGKGLEAALYALLISGLMRGLHKAGTEPAELVADLNRRLYYRSPPDKYCCLSYAVIDLERRLLSYTSAGLPFPLLFRSRTSRPIELTGLPVGLFNPCEYDQIVIELKPGDRLLFYTDGLPDSLRVLSHSRGDGARQLRQLFPGDPSETASQQAERMVAHLQSRPPRLPLLFDDVTFLVVHVL